MMASPIPQPATFEARSISDLYQQVRARTLEIVAPLEIEDYVVQTAEFMSPPRWHIGHTTWFFETVLQKYQPGYKTYSEDFLFFFNSYYEGFGQRIERPKRGTRSRPTVAQTVAYRAHIDEQMARFIEQAPNHGEAENILARAIERVTGMAEVEGGLFELGYGNAPVGERGSSPTVREGSISESGNKSSHSKNYDFAFDNEKPQHKVFLQDFLIDRALVSNGDYLEFIKAGGYQDFRWWHSAGWEKVNSEQWSAPLYWEQKDGEWMIRDFAGLHQVRDKLNEPVSHISFLEASAYAKWAGKRLPTEAEWEKAASFAPALNAKREFPWGDAPPDDNLGNLFENGLWSVAPIGAFPDGQSLYGCQQMIGDVWEWTTSDYTPYPGFKSEFDEYNDKWFVGQKVLRGGSFATPRLHIRTTYRNFFHPEERWMVSGFRCAKDNS